MGPRQPFRALHYQQQLSCCPMTTVQQLLSSGCPIRPGAVCMLHRHHTVSAEKRSLTLKLFMAQFVNTALSSLVANMYIPALYKRLQDTVLGTLIFQVAFPQPCTKADHGLVHSGGQKLRPCSVQAPVEHLPMHSHFPGGIPQPCTKADHSPVQTDCQYTYPCLVPLPAGHLPRRTYLLGRAPQSCMKLEHSPVWSGGQFIRSCKVQVPTEQPLRHTNLPGAMPTTMYL